MSCLTCFSATLEQGPEGKNTTSNTSITALAFRSHTGNSHSHVGHCCLFAHCALVLTINNRELCRCLSCGSFLFPLFSTTETRFPLCLPLCPADQLRGSHVLPVQSVSIQELQAQLEQETRLHREEQEKFTERIIQVNTKPGCWERRVTLPRAPRGVHLVCQEHGSLSPTAGLFSLSQCGEFGSWGDTNSSPFCSFESGFSDCWK